MKLKFASLFAFLLLLSMTQVVFATPDAPKVVINETTLQCDATFYWRDECGEAILPQGWAYSSDAACPAGYAAFDLRAEWSKYQNNYCCQQRGEDYCLEETETALQTLTVEETLAPAQAPAQEDSFVAPVAGGLSLLVALGLGAFGLLRRKKR